MITFGFTPGFVIFPIAPSRRIRVIDGPPQLALHIQPTRSDKCRVQVHGRQEVFTAGRIY